MTPSHELARALLIGVEPATLERVCRILAERGAGAGTTAVDTVDEALGVFEAAGFDIAILRCSQARSTDLNRLLAATMQSCPDTIVIALAAEGEVGLALDGLKAGLTDFARLPLDEDELCFILDKALKSRQSSLDLPPDSGHRTGLVGQSRAMRGVMDLVQRAAPGNSTVLLRGESGTGKELVARAIHARSARAHGPFVKVQCSALPETLLESELFGYEKGAFTGASSRRPGRVEVAEGGSLFLDEIGDITLATQVKLLRLLQDREYESLGSNKTKRADVRFVAATHRSLEAMVKQETFRADLFYRLNVVPLWLPPLRARRSDIPLLATHFVQVFGAQNGRHIRFDPEALEFLRIQRWPGNVRQLQNFVERLVILSQGDSVSLADMKAAFTDHSGFSTQLTHGPPSTSRPHSGQSSDSTSPPSSSGQVLPLSEELRVAERRALLRALKFTGNNRTVAARILGVSRATLYNKLVEHGLV